MVKPGSYMDIMLQDPLVKMNLFLACYAIPAVGAAGLAYLFQEQEPPEQVKAEQVKKGELPLEQVRARGDYVKDVIEKLADRYGGNGQILANQKGPTDFRIDDSLGAATSLKVSQVPKTDQVTASVIFNGNAQDPNAVSELSVEEAAQRVSALVKYYEATSDAASKFNVQERAFGKYSYKDGDVVAPDLSTPKKP